MSKPKFKVGQWVRGKNRQVRGYRPRPPSKVLRVIEDGDEHAYVLDGHLAYREAELESCRDKSWDQERI